MKSGSVLSIIAAATHENVIGKDNGLLWRIPSDMQRFRMITMGHPVIMGRRTWESLPEKYRPLPERTNIVVTHNTAYTAPDAGIAHSIEEALAIARLAPGAEEIFFIGGETIYREALALADKIYLTRVYADVVGDAYFPEINLNLWKVMFHFSPTFLDKDNHATSFMIYERIIAS